MEDLGERPVWSMSDSELLSALDDADTDLAQVLSRRLQLLRRADEAGIAQNLGARDTVELLAIRYRLDRRDAHREVKLARALPKYETVSTALTNGIPPPDTVETIENKESDQAATTTDTDGLPAGATTTDTDGLFAGAARDADRRPGGGARLLRPAQAGAIVSALERVRSRVPADDLDVAETQLVTLAAHLSPGQLAKAARQICDLLDSDGPEPDEHAAYARESLTTTDADNGVKFHGYLANENAELFRAWIHTGARPHKTHDGELDPRPRDKRQADALTTALTIATAAADTGLAATPHPADTGVAPKPATTLDSTGSGVTPEPATTPDPTGAGDTSKPPNAPGSVDLGTHETAATDTRPTEAVADVLPLETFADNPPVPSTSSWVPGFGAKANITVTIDLEDLKAATANATGTLVYGNNLSAATIRRLACDANIIPLVLGSNSEPLDVGRSQRLVTRAIRRALNTRDKGCVICGAPPITCDVSLPRSGGRVGVCCFVSYRGLVAA